MKPVKKSLLLCHNVGIREKLLNRNVACGVEAQNPKGEAPNPEQLNRGYMNFTKKNLILFIIIGILVSGIPVITSCSSYCVSNDLDLDSLMDGSCPFSFHSFVQIIIVLSALFVLPLAGFFLVRDRQFISPGVYWPLFKPPRFSL
jgi:hypothetical protein